MFLDQYAPFEADTPAGMVTFVGQGMAEASEAEQRMIAEWARQVQLEAESGRSGASWGLGIAWHREGGIAGFCDDLTVYVTGQVYAASCRTEPAATVAQRFLTEGELSQLYRWIDTFAAFEEVQSDGDVPDAMTTRLVFSGAGEEAAGVETKQAIADFAATLYTELTS